MYLEIIYEHLNQGGMLVQLQSPRFDSELRLRSVLSFTCSQVCVSFFRVLWFPPAVQDHAGWWTKSSKLPLGGNVCVGVDMHANLD